MPFVDHKGHTCHLTRLIFKSQWTTILTRAVLVECSGQKPDDNIMLYHTKSYDIFKFLHNNILAIKLLPIILYLNYYHHYLSFHTMFVKTEHIPVTMSCYINYKSTTLQISIQQHIKIRSIGELLNRYYNKNKMLVWNATQTYTDDIVIYQYLWIPTQHIAIKLIMKLIKRYYNIFVYNMLVWNRANPHS